MKQKSILHSTAIVCESQHSFDENIDFNVSLVRWEFASFHDLDDFMGKKGFPD